MVLLLKIVTFTIGLLMVAPVFLSYKPFGNPRTPYLFAMGMFLFYLATK